MLSTLPIVTILLLLLLLSGVHNTASVEASTATLTLTSDTGACGTEIRFEGTGFEPGTETTVFAGPYPGDSFWSFEGQPVAPDGTVTIESSEQRDLLNFCRGGFPPVDGAQYLIGLQTGTNFNHDLREPSTSAIYAFEYTAFEYFQRTWNQTDKPVADGQINRSWIWGDSVSDLMTEEYVESPGGERTVQYFDKSRMEITHPDTGDPESDWYVTNGLLAVELISGQRQVGDEEFIQYLPSDQNVAGDPGFPNGPSYATFLNLHGPTLHFQDPLLEPGDHTGEIVNHRLDRSGEITLDAGLDREGIRYVFYDEVTDHNIAGPFWSFMNSSGPVWEDGVIVDAQLFPNPFYATGRPVSEAFWSDVIVGGDERLVLIQCFERRCLIYTPDNPEGWQVEAGNIGQHYYAWRYQEQPPVPDGELLIVNSSFDPVLGVIDKLSVLDVASGEVRDLSGELQGRISDQSWSPDGQQIVFSYVAADGSNSYCDNCGAIYIMNADGSNLRQITSNGYDPAWSPDSTQIVFVRLLTDPVEDPFEYESQLFLIDADGTNERQLTFIPPPDLPDASVDASLSFNPAWSPDGAQIAFFHIDLYTGSPPTVLSTLYIVNSDGTDPTSLDWLGYRPSLAWSPDSQQLLIMEPMGGGRDTDGAALWIIEPGGEARLIAGNDHTNPHSAAWSPDGSQIALAWGLGSIGLISPNGSVLTQMPTLAAGGLSWSPDGQHLVYDTRYSLPYSNVSKGLNVVVRITDAQQWIVARDGYQPLWRP